MRSEVSNSTLSIWDPQIWFHLTTPRKQYYKITSTIAYINTDVGITWCLIVVEVMISFQKQLHEVCWEDFAHTAIYGSEVVISINQLPSVLSLFKVPQWIDDLNSVARCRMNSENSSSLSIERTSQRASSRNLFCQSLFEGINSYLESRKNNAIINYFYHYLRIYNINEPTNNKPTNNKQQTIYWSTILESGNFFNIPIFSSRKSRIPEFQFQIGRIKRQACTIQQYGGYIFTGKYIYSIWSDEADSFSGIPGIPIPPVVQRIIKWPFQPIKEILFGWGFFLKKAKV